MSGGIDRDKANAQRMRGERISEEIHERYDRSAVLKNVDAQLAHKREVEQVDELLARKDLPAPTRSMLEGWKEWLGRAGKTAHLSPRCAAVLRGVHFRYVTMDGAPVPEGWKPKGNRAARRERPPIADFLRDPTLLPKRPPGRAT